MRWHGRTDAPVVLGRASGSVRWGRGSQCSERETVCSNHSSGVILQPDRLLQACLHLSVSFHPLHPCFPPLPSCACCHCPSLHLLLLLLQTPFCPAIADTIPRPPSLPTPQFFIPVRKAAPLSASFFLAISHLPRHFSPSTFLCALQTVPGCFSVFLHLPSFILPPLPCAVTLHLGRFGPQMG